MKYGKRNRPGRSLLSSPFALVGALIVLVFVVQATGNIRSRVEISERRRLQAEAEKNKLIEHENKLVAEISRLSTDQGLESELRTKYRAMKEGESVAVIIDNKENLASLAGASSSENLPPKTTWLRSLLRSLGL